MTEEEAQSRLFALNLCASRMIHTLRTPLGVAFSVMSDLADGHTLAGEELADGRSALLRIKTELERAAILARTPWRKEITPLSTVLQSVAEQVGANISCSICEDKEVLCDPEFLFAGFEALLGFLHQGCGAEAPIRILLSGDVRIECGCPKKLEAKPFGSLTEMAALDPRHHAVLALFAEAVFALYGGRSAACAEGPVLRVTVLLPGNRLGW